MGRNENPPAERWNGELRSCDSFEGGLGNNQKIRHPQHSQRFDRKHIVSSLQFQGLQAWQQAHQKYQRLMLGNSLFIFFIEIKALHIFCISKIYEISIFIFEIMPYSIPHLLDANFAL
jgi:hypothetical protein